MRKLLPFLVLTIALAGLAGWYLDVSRIYPTLQPISVILSIMAAAIFVRLNRGMPTIDWKALTAEERNSLTNRMVSIAGDYIVGLALCISAILTLVVVVALGAPGIPSPAQAVQTTPNTGLPPGLQAGIVGWFMLMVGVSMVWMGYVVWRDYDIVLLQKRVIDAASEREQRQKDAQAATEKSNAMKSAGVTVASTSVRPFHST